MSDAITLDPRLDRSSRLEELLLSTLAMPLPAAPISMPLESYDIQAGAEALLDQTQVMQNGIEAPQPSADAIVRLDMTPNETHADAVDGSLQASLDAIHVSLDQAASENSASFTPEAVQSNNEPQLLARAMGTHAMPIGDAMTAATVHSVMAVDPAEANSADAGPLQANFTSPIAPSVVPEPFGTVVQIADIPASAAVSLGAALNVVENHFTDVLSNPAATLPDLTEVVTVPSLDGDGFDTLTGLLPQPMNVGPGSTDVDLPTHFDHPLLSIPIGLDDGHHDAGSVQHPALSLIGSGLI